MVYYQELPVDSESFYTVDLVELASKYDHFYEASLEESSSIESETKITAVDQNAE